MNFNDDPAFRVKVVHSMKEIAEGDFDGADALLLQRSIEGLFNPLSQKLASGSDAPLAIDTAGFTALGGFLNGRPGMGARFIQSDMQLLEDYGAHPYLKTAFGGTAAPGQTKTGILASYAGEAPRIVRYDAQGRETGSFPVSPGDIWRLPDSPKASYRVTRLGKNSAPQLFLATDL
jgi:hypothetical protein